MYVNQSLTILSSPVRPAIYPRIAVVNTSQQVAIRLALYANPAVYSPSAVNRFNVLKCSSLQNDIDLHRLSPHEVFNLFHNLRIGRLDTIRLRFYII